jgi:hypothetical protein
MVLIITVKVVNAEVDQHESILQCDVIIFNQVQECTQQSRKKGKKRQCVSKIERHVRDQTCFSKLVNFVVVIKIGGTWPRGQRGALASRRSQVRIPVVAVN